MYDWLFSELVEKLIDQIDGASDAMSRGQNSHSDYDGLAGKCNGLRVAITVVEDLQTLINSQNEEEETP